MMDIQACLIKLGYKAVVWENERIVPHVLETRPIPSMKELEAAWKEVLVDREKGSADTEKEAMIQAKIREMAISALEAEGKLKAGKAA